MSNTSHKIRAQIQQEHGRVMTNTEYCVRLPAGPHLVKVPSRGGLRVGARSKLKLGGEVIDVGIQWYRIDAKDRLITLNFERASEDSLRKRFGC